MNPNDLTMPLCEKVLAVQDCMYDPGTFEDNSGDIWEHAYDECTKHMHLATEDYTLVGGDAQLSLVDFGDDITRRRLEACMMKFKIMVDAHQDMGLEANDNTYSDTYQACNACNTLYIPIMNNLMNETLNELMNMSPTSQEQQQEYMRPVGGAAMFGIDMDEQGILQTAQTGALEMEAPVWIGGMDGMDLPAGAISMSNVADTQACQVVLPDNESYTCNYLVANINQTFFEYEMDKLSLALNEFAGSTLTGTGGLDIDVAQGEMTSCGPGWVDFMDLSENDRATVRTNTSEMFDMEMDDNALIGTCFSQQELCELNLQQFCTKMMAENM